ncbi:unnamed protein product, partial [Mesorhabditis spiculigera]
MFLRKFWNEWTLQENARRMKITVLPSGTKKVHLRSPSELDEMEKQEKRRRKEEERQKQHP